MCEIRIDNPCPMLVSRFEKNGDDFNCGSCSKKVYDFRGKPSDEIESFTGIDICGVFDISQVSNTPEYTGFRKAAFLGLMVLSFLGFNVGPLKAQVAPSTDSLITKEKTKVNQPESATQKDSTTLTNGKSKTGKAVRRKNRKKKKRKGDYVMGCPAF